MKAALIIALVGWIIATGDEAHWKKEVSWIKRAPEKANLLSSRN